MTAVEFTAVDKRYGETFAVRDLSLSIEAGETFALVGESGSGKTTALRLINRLVDATAGVVRVFGDDVREVDAPTLRRRIGYVIQGAGLFAHLSVRDNVAVVPQLLEWDEAKTAAAIESWLSRVGLPLDEYGHRFPSELSGGQRQRVGIARALAADPPMVLLDEPFGALDPVTKEKMQDEFVALSAALDKTFVIVTHDLREAVRLGDRIGVMQGGELIRLGTPAQIVDEPEHPFVRAMLGRNRLQLRWMTTPLSSLLERAQSSSKERDAGAPRLDAHHTVWDALARCEAERRDGVTVGTGEDAVFIARQTLLLAADAQATVIK